MIAIVAGATGLVGEILTRKLLETAEVQRVIIVARKELNLSNPKLSTVLVPDFKNLAAHSNELKGTHYFCALGTTIKTAGSQEKFREVDFDAVLAFGQLASQHQATCLSVVSAMGANANSSFFYNRVKGEAEKALQALPLKSLRLYRPGLLLGSRREHRSGEKAATHVASVLKVVLPNRWFKSLATEASDLAQRMIDDSTSPSPGLGILSAREI